MSTFLTAVFIIHITVTFFMTGVIWVIDRVHYPLFSLVGKETFTAYETLHAARITTVVLVPMLLEVMSFIGLNFLSALDSIRWSYYVSGLCLVIIWVLTFFVLVPLHGGLSEGFSVALHERLLTYNALRTALWTLRSLCCIYWLYFILTQFIHTHR